jgi:hypothetical protein
MAPIMMGRSSVVYVAAAAVSVHSRFLFPCRYTASTCAAIDTTLPTVIAAPTTPTLANAAAVAVAIRGTSSGAFVVVFATARPIPIPIRIPIPVSVTRRCLRARPIPTSHTPCPCFVFCFVLVVTAGPMGRRWSGSA